MEKKKSSAILQALLYLTVSVGFAVSYLFAYPQYDVMIFSRDVGNSIADAVRESLYYGNGRFLGNVLGFYFSNHFVESLFFTSLMMTLFTAMLNCLFFDGRKSCIFPIAVIIAFPALGIVREVYFMLAAFCNYAVPLFFVLLTCIILKQMCFDGSRWLYVPLALSAFCSCLFSENTTVVIGCLAFLILVREYIDKKKITPQSVVNFVFTAAGALTMYLIPKLMGTSEKLSDYRSFVTEPTALYRNVISGVRAFALIANQFVLVYAVISFVMLSLLFRSRIAKALKLLIAAILVVFPISCIFPICFASFAYRYSSVYIPLEIAYLAAIIIVAIVTKNKNLIWATLMTVVLLGSAVGPILIVNHRGDRTFFTVFAIFLFYAAHLAASFGMEINSGGLKKTVRIASPILFAAVCAFVFMQSVYNFDGYAFRADKIAQERTVSAEISVPYLPRERFAAESKWGQIDPFIFGDELKPTFTVVDADEWEYAQEYEKIKSAPLKDAVRYAASHWSFKDPEYPEKLYKEYSAKNKKSIDISA